jgi:hypothetical protein
MAAAENPETPVELTSNQKNSKKGLRYYYRHREEILEKIRQKRLEDPECAAKQAAREARRQAEAEAKAEAKRQAQEQRDALKRERDAVRAAKEAAKEAAMAERRRAKAAALGLSSSGQ